MCLEITIGIAIIRWIIFGYLAYRAISYINWPMFLFYIRGGMV